MLTYLTVAVLAIVAGVLIVAARKPDVFEVRRSATIGATPERIFALLEDFRNWGEWSPYEKKDPAMTRSFPGATSGTGAVYAFEGNNQVGAGQLAIVEVEAPGKLAVTLDMTRPMACSNLITFTLGEVEGGTQVTWHMQGPWPFLGKLMGTVFNMDRMVGRDFEQGLSALRDASERPGPAAVAA
jgi:uncharacterized protein YndB with AHSA1/START domain